MLSEMNKKGIENQKEKEKEQFNYSTINKDYEVNFPNIDSYNKYNNSKKSQKIRIRNHNIILKSLKYDIKNNSIGKSKQNLLESKKNEPICPKSENKKSKNYFPNYENNKQYRTINYNKRKKVYDGKL